jgi:hypothetical protein
MNIMSISEVMRRDVNCHVQITSDERKYEYHVQLPSSQRIFTLGSSCTLRVLSSHDMPDQTIVVKNGDKFFLLNKRSEFYTKQAYRYEIGYELVET